MQLYFWFSGWERLGSAASIGIDRLGRKHKVEWVKAKSSIFYNSTLRYAVERHLMRTLKKTPTIHWATDSFIYIVILL